MSKVDQPESDPREPSENIQPPTWHERHGATILGAVLAGLFALVLTIQAAC